jgi:peptidylprolyl isomerase
VLRRTRRPAAVLAAVPLVLVLAACGSDSDSGSEDDSTSSSASDNASDNASDSAAPAGDAAGLDQVSFEGAVGEGLTTTWEDEVPAVDETTVTTLVDGDGDEVADGDTAKVYLYLGDGTTQKDLYNGYDSGAPQSIPYSEDLDPLFRELLDGATYGSRVVAVTDTATVFGDQAADNSFGVDEGDTLVVVADVVEKAVPTPTPTSNEAEDADPAAQPEVVEDGGTVTGLDFDGVEEPPLDQPVQRLVLREGDGAEVKADDTVTVNYLGATYDADAPFDESYSKGQPLTSALSGLIQGWTIGLTGVKVGSRVLLQIPPAFGYGADGSGASIPGNATLWFVIDVESVS